MKKILIFFFVFNQTNYAKMVHKLQIRFADYFCIAFCLNFKEKEELCKLVYCKTVTKRKKLGEKRDRESEREEKVNKAIEKRFAYQANAVWHLVYFAVGPFASVDC